MFVKESLKTGGQVGQVGQIPETIDFMPALPPVACPLILPRVYSIRTRSVSKGRKHL